MKAEKSYWEDCFTVIDPRITPDGVFLEPNGSERRTATKVTEWEYPAWVCYRDRQDNECFVVFDEAFLLNDNGQTIERIR